MVPYGLALGDTLCRATADGGSYQAIMLHERDERPAVLFRLIQANGGLTYHDVIFGGTGRSGPRIVDVFSYGTGEYLTETMGRMLTTRGSTVASRFAERFVGRRATASPMRVALDSMRSLVAAGTPHLALRYFAELPEEVRADKLLLLERLGIARDVGEREAVAAVREMRRRHPDDVSLNLALIDYHFLRNELDSTLAVIERLDRAVDRDPYLAYMRASIHRLRDDTVNMRHWAERAIHGDRSLHYPYWMLLDLSLVRGDHKLTFKLLRWLERFARYDVDDLDVAADQRYRRFVGSKEYAEWRQWRAWWKRKLESLEPHNGEKDVPLVPEDEEEESVPRPLT